jgi:hypothetical protein
MVTSGCRRSQFVGHPGLTQGGRGGRADRLAASGLLPGEGISALLLAATICGRFLSCENFRARNPGVEGPYACSRCKRSRSQPGADHSCNSCVSHGRLRDPKGQQAAGGTSTVQVAPGARAIPRASRAVPAKQRDHHSGGQSLGRTMARPGFWGAFPTRLAPRNQDGNCTGIRNIVLSCGA